MQRKTFTDTDIDLIRELYPSVKTEELAAKMDRPVSSVYNKAFALGLKKSKEFLKTEASGRILRHDHAGRRHQFKKGHNPWNAGKRGTHFSRKTEFKKGGKPANTLHDGAITIRKDTSVKTGKVSYWKYIRISEGKWALLNRYVWESVNGPIPKKHVISFKDGDTMNCDIENLECISMAENAVRNRNTEKAQQTMQSNLEEGLPAGARGVSDNYIAGIIARKDKQLKEKILAKFPELIELKRQQVRLNRIIKIKETNDNN